MVRIKTESIGDIRRTPIGDCEIQDLNLIDHGNGSYFTRYLLKDLLGKLADDMHRNVQRDYDNVNL